MPKQFIGIVIGPAGVVATLPAPIVIAPSEANILPSIVQFVPRLIAPGCDIKFPFMTLFAPTWIAPSEIQKTLAALVPLLKTIVELVPIVNAPSYLIINTASGFPRPSSISLFPTEPAPGIE